MTRGRKMGQSNARWRQDDPRLNRAEAWPASLFPDAAYRYFRDAGCLVCALTVMLNECSVENEQDEAVFNPWVLNQRLISCGAFSSDADLELEDIARLYPLDYLGEVPYSREALLLSAKKGAPCLVTVPGVNAARHFTALLDVTEDDALVFDPCCGERILSSYDQVCELRLFTIEEEGLEGSDE